MAMNPYLPDMRKVETAYSSAKYENDAISKKMSLSHPYQSSQDVIDAIKNAPEQKESILSKMSTDLRKDRTEMLRIIGRHEGAYLYAHKDIDDQKFKLAAVYKNPSVYSLLPEKDRNSPEVVKEYLNAMSYRRLDVKKLDSTTEALQFTQKLSDKLPVDLAFTPELYRQSYEDMVVKGPYVGPWRPDIVSPHSDREILGEGFLYIATAKMLNPGQIPTYDKIEHDVWMSHPEKIKELAMNDRRDHNIDNALTAIEERCPEMRLEIQEKQREYWNSRKPEITELQIKIAEGERLQRQEMELVRESMRHLEFSKEERKEMAHRIEQKRIENVAALQRDSQEAIYAAYARGDIEFDAATGRAAYIEALPSKGSAYRAYESLAQAEAIENDTHNVVEPNAPNSVALRTDDAIDATLEDAHIERWDAVTREQLAEDDYEEYQALLDERAMDEDELDRVDDRTEDEIYEEEYAGNPFISYEPSEGLTQTYNPFAQ